jgi:FMN phosphatase YigB (HAD superfamily)
MALSQPLKPNFNSLHFMIEGIVFDWIGTLYRRNTGLFEGVEDILQTLKQKYKLGLVTRAGQGIPKRQQEIEGTCIVPYFDTIIISTQKEEQQFCQCLEQMGIEPQNTLVVGDRTVREIRIGNTLGCQTYWIQKGDYAHELPTKETGVPTRIITSVHDIIKYL